MSESAPVVYILHGEDEYGMTGFVLAMQDKLGDPTTVDMNVTRLEGSSNLDIEGLRAAASAMPFLAARRMVVVENPIRRLNSQPQRDKFKALMDELPPSTALVLMESKTLPDGHWLIKWAMKAKERAFIRAYSVPKGPQMTRWIQDYARKQDGNITHEAAALLGELAGDDPRLAALEIDKLLAYVNYNRPIEIDDVDNLAAFMSGEVDYFKFIDALAAGSSRAAMEMLHRLLDEQAPLQLFFSLVGHFRLLLQAREVIERGGQAGQVAEELKIHPYRAQKLAAQAKTLSLANLEAIYRRLLDYDLEIKTGQIAPELALETLVAVLTQAG